MVERLGFRGCERLRKVHPSIKYLSLYSLDLRECSHLKVLGEPSGQLNQFYSWVKRSPEPMKHWASMSYLYLGHCSNLTHLPKQLGDMKGLKELDANGTAIQELPDSITQLRGMLRLILSNCKNLRKLPEDIGNMEGLERFSAANCAIEQLPDSFVGLTNLVSLDLSDCKKFRNLPNRIWKLKLLKWLDLSQCSKLERLPDELGEMQCLEYLCATHTAIEQVPDSIERLSRLRVLNLNYCEKLKYVPSSVWNLTSLAALHILQWGNGTTNLPDTVKNTKLATLSLKCDIRLWLPMILSFSSLEQLVLRDYPIETSSEFSLYELYNLQFLELYKCTRFGSWFVELPPNLTCLSLCDHTTLVYLPDLSCLKQLKRLDIIRYHSLVSLPPLPPHLQSLMVYDCTSLHSSSDMSMMKELVDLSFGRHTMESFGYHQVEKLAEWSWFRYKSSGRTRTLCFDIPLLGDNLLGLAVCVLFTSKYKERCNIRVVVANKTSGITECFWIPAFYTIEAEVYPLARCIRCISRDLISIRSGDRIEISFARQLYSFDGESELPYEQVKVEKCAARVIEETPSIPRFPFIFNSLIEGV